MPALTVSKLFQCYRGDTSIPKQGVCVGIDSMNYRIEERKETL